MPRRLHLPRIATGALAALAVVGAGLHAGPVWAAPAPHAGTDVVESFIAPDEQFGPDAYIAPTADADTIAQVAGDPNRPIMAIPFRCGQKWRGATYSYHNPRLAIDFNLWGTGGDADLGKPVIASQSGTVLATTRYSGKGYGQTVLIGHGHGYRSFYAHLKIGSLTVKVGDKVRANQRIGRVGKSGQQSSAHLHYEQRRYGQVIPIWFGKASPVQYYSAKAYKRIRYC